MADCLFCKIAAGEIPAKVVKRTDYAVAFRDIDPQAPTHVLVMPIRHLAAVREFRGEADELLLGKLLTFTAELATELGVDRSGYRIVTNTGADARQSVEHLHFHLIGGRKMGWPPG